MNETLKDIAIVSGALVVGAGLGVAIDVEAPIDPTPIVEEIEKPVDEIKPDETVKPVPVDEKAVFIDMPEDKVKVQAWSEESVNKVQSRIQDRTTVLTRVKTALEERLIANPDDIEASGELVNVNKELEAMQSAEAKMEIIETKVIEAQ